MKKIIILFVILFSAQRIPAQENKTDMLIVHIEFKRELGNYFAIAADRGVPSANDLYNLKQATITYPDEDDPGYTRKTKERISLINKDSIEYNYFKTESAALNYILSKKWKLFSAIPHVMTGEAHGGSSTGYSYSNWCTSTKYLFTRSE
jgi:hypothetical protein